MRGWSGCISCQKRLTLGWEVDDYKPLPTTATPLSAPCTRRGVACVSGPTYPNRPSRLLPHEKSSPAAVQASVWCLPADQGLTLAHFRAQLGAFGNTSFTLEHNLSTLGTQQQVNMGCMWDKVSLS